MDGKKKRIGLCMLCALLVSAFAAQAAAAATNGTTAFTCVKGAGTLKGEHCLTTGSKPAEYGHVAVAENLATEGSTTNGNTSSETGAATPAIFKVTIAGTPLELKATGVSGTGTFENKKAASGEHFIAGTGTTSYSGVTVVRPEGKGCKVFEDNGGVEGTEGVVKTNNLKGTTQGLGDSGRLEAAEGATIAAFFVTCNKGEVPEALEGTWTITGTLTCKASGATVSCVHSEVTTQNTLKAKGAKAGIEGALTVSGRNPAKDPAGVFTPLSATTVETP